MRWKVHGQRTLYQSDWVNVEVADVELPDGRRLYHHALRIHRQSVSAAVIDDQGRVLMLWRHRFITDRWGWELPCGWVDLGEDPAEATRREVLEETGWEPGTLKLLCSYGADVGISDARFHLYQADGATWQGPPTDNTEAARVAWIPLSEVRELLDRSLVDDAASITALLYLLAFAPIGTAMKPGEPVPEAGAS
jgi:8-oxo-dGTP pyrophosphatase MutT (NUDIX family)